MQRLALVNRSWLTTIPLLLGGIVVGLLMTLRSGAAPQTINPSRNTAASLSVTRVTELRARQQSLNSDLTRLREEQGVLQRKATENQGNLEEIRTQIDAQNQLAGLSALRGPGVVVTLDDSTSSLPSDAVDVNRYIVHQQQLVTLVGVLWNTGAEAISINEQRVTDQTSIYCVGSTIIINQELLAPPFTIRAIGDPASLESAAITSPLLADLWSRQREYGVVINVKQKNQVQVPAYTGPVTRRHLVAAP
ncbi:MAG: DUF881 domain-containing protein [Herpetosiphonaceae bacterium]|nr:DUF881 domain-containing protein [Herpetosiphonaceae bacterium]